MSNRSLPPGLQSLRFSRGALLPTISDIRQTFEREVKQLQGKITRTHQRESTLHMRSLLPFVGEPRPQDQLQGGLAIRVDHRSIRVYPYTLRKVCSNGAVMEKPTGNITVELQRFDFTPVRQAVDAFLWQFCQLVRETATLSTFSKVMKQVTASTSPLTKAAADEAARMLPYQPQFDRSVSNLHRILQLYREHGDRTAYGLMNAITQVARDEPDPLEQWDLEQLGGAIPALLTGLPAQHLAASDRAVPSTAAISSLRITRTGNR